jgi:hypothetical protein
MIQQSTTVDPTTVKAPGATLYVEVQGWGSNPQEFADRQHGLLQATTARQAGFSSSPAGWATSSAIAGYS